MVYIRNIKIYMFSLLLPAAIFPRSIRPPDTHGTGERQAGTPSEVTCTPTARQMRTRCEPAAWTTADSLKGMRWKKVGKEANGLRCGVVGWLVVTHTPSPAPTSDAAAFQEGQTLATSYRRHGSALVPSGLLVKIGYLFLTWSLEDLEKATSFPATVSTLWFRQHGPACQRARVPIRATSADDPAPAAQPRFARLSTCGPAYRPGSRADFTPRIFDPLSGAFDYA